MPVIIYHTVQLPTSGPFYNWWWLVNHPVLQTYVTFHYHTSQWNCRIIILSNTHS